MSLLVLLIAAPLRAQTTCVGPEFAALDRWIGGWQQVDAEGRSQARTTFEKIDGGCGVLGRWQAPEYGSGTVLLSFDAARGEWSQQRVDSRGVVASLNGVSTPEGLSFSGSGARADGSSFDLRIELAMGDDGRPAQTVSESIDGGTTWSEPSVSFLEPVAAASTPTSGGGTAPSDEPVRAVSDAADREQLAIGDRRQVPMASPMTLEVEAGALHLFPEGAAWRTDETAEFVSNRVTVRGVSLARRERKGRLEIEVELLIYTTKSSVKLDAQVAIVSEGETVLESERETVKIGLPVAAYDPQTGLRRAFRFEIDSAQFDAWFADDRRPRVRVTLDVPPV